MATKRARPTGTIHTAREPYATIGELVNDRDRQYFLDHPDEPNYLRPYVPGEHSPESLSAAGMPPPGQDDWVLVWNVAPGMRVRQHLGPIVSARPVNGRMTIILPDDVIENVPVVSWEAA